MDQNELVCVCGQKALEPGKCPACGREISRSRKGAMGLSDSEIEATHEILAEEGAIWSGAR